MSNEPTKPNKSSSQVDMPQGGINKLFYILVKQELANAKTVGVPDPKLAFAIAKIDNTKMKEICFEVDKEAGLLLVWIPQTKKDREKQVRKKSQLILTPDNKIISLN